MLIKRPVKIASVDVTTCVLSSPPVQSLAVESSISKSVFSGFPFEVQFTVTLVKFTAVQVLIVLLKGWLANVMVETDELHALDDPLTIDKTLA